MLFFKRKERKGERFLFQFKRGKANETERLGRGILDRIAKVQRVFHVLISAAVNVHVEYGLSCSFRRGSTSEAINREVADLVVDRNNRRSIILEENFGRILSRRTEVYKG